MIVKTHSEKLIETMKRSSFEPHINQETQILILGSMPGVKSLEEAQYYAHPRNFFWKIIYSIYQEEYEDNYEKRIEFLLSQNIGLWDVIESCEREGSLDSAIRSEVPNDFKRLFEMYPNINLVIFNGAKAYDVFKRKIGFEMYSQIKFVKMGSTSPARAVSFDQKLKEWEAVLCKK